MCFPPPGSPGCSCPARPCTSFLVWQTCDDRNRLAFWEHMGDIPQEVAIHIGICWWVPLTDNPLLLLLLLQATVLGLSQPSMASYMPVFQPYESVWCPEARHFPDTCILLMMLLVKADCWSACIYLLLLPKTRAPDNLPPHFTPAHSCLVTHTVLRPYPFVWSLHSKYRIIVYRETIVLRREQ